MLPDTAKDALVETVVQSLETMAFVMAEPITPPVDSPISPVGVSLKFSGPKSGRVEIVASREFTMVLAANVLGSDPSDDDAHEKADDCMKELVNVVGGALMPHIADSDAETYKLSLPTLHSVDTELDWPNIAACPSTQLLNAEGHILAIRLIDAA